DNIAHLLGNPHFETMRHDVCFPLYVEVDEIYNLACPASPIHYQFDPVQTTKTSVLGAINMLGLAKRVKAKIFQSSTSEVYGEPTRAFCFVDDLVEGFLRLMAASDDVTGPINLGNPVETTVRELAEKIIAMIGSRSKIESRPLPVDDPTQRCPDISRARNLLEWEPHVPLETGLERTIAYFNRLLSERGDITGGVLRLRA